MHILMIEGNSRFASETRQALTRLGYTVSWLRDARSALVAMRNRTADLALIDLDFPRCDGIDVVKHVRSARMDTPILVTSSTSDLPVRVATLDAGADDYMARPVHMDELAARIRSLIRRRRGFSVNRLVAGDLSVDLGTSEVTFRGEKVRLTRRELSLLQSLVGSAGRFVPRHSLEDSIYGWDMVVGDNAIEVLVHGLRRKLGSQTIRNVRGIGYSIAHGPDEQHLPSPQRRPLIRNTTGQRTTSTGTRELDKTLTTTDPRNRLLSSPRP